MAINRIGPLAEASCHEGFIEISRPNSRESGDGQRNNYES